MKNFSQLFSTLERNLGPSFAIDAIVEYFENSSDQDKIWLIAFIMRTKPSRLATLKQLKKWAEDTSELPNWLLEESYNSTGDVVETISSILPKRESITEHSLSEWVNKIIAHKNSSQIQIKNFIITSWTTLDFDERYLFNKLIIGSLRIKASEKLLVTALSKVIDATESQIAIRLSIDWHPINVSYKNLLLDTQWINIPSNSYRFRKINEEEFSEKQLENKEKWLAEWHWEGMNAQIIKQKNHINVWSKSEGLITKKVPEFELLLDLLDDDFILEGIIVVFRNGKIRSRQELLKRTKSAKVSKKLMSEYPLIFIAFDLLECNQVDMTSKAYKNRKTHLAKLLSKSAQKISDILLLSDFLIWNSWEELNNLRNSARAINANGIQLIQSSTPLTNESPIDSSSIFWRVDPYKINAVLLYAQKGQAKQSNQYIEFSFAVAMKDHSYIPITKTSNSLNKQENLFVESFIKDNTIEKFGPVRSIKPELVCEISFTNVIVSKRHKSGIILQDAKITHLNNDLGLEDVGQLEELKLLMHD